MIVDSIARNAKERKTGRNPRARHSASSNCAHWVAEGPRGVGALRTTVKRKGAAKCQLGSYSDRSQRNP